MLLKYLASLPSHTTDNTSSSPYPGYSEGVSINVDLESPRSRFPIITVFYKECWLFGAHFCFKNASPGWTLRIIVIWCCGWEKFTVKVLKSADGKGILISRIRCAVKAADLNLSLPSESAFGLPLSLCITLNSRTFCLKPLVSSKPARDSLLCAIFLVAHLRTSDPL